MTATALTIAGSDPSGGAGLQADLKTFHQHQVFGMSVVTLVTVQNTCSVDGVDCLSAERVAEQMRAVAGDIPPVAAKTGALGNAAVIETVASNVETLACPLVVDPVMISKHGFSLIDDDAVAVLKSRLLPKAYLITPNLFEAQALSGMSIESAGDIAEAGKALLDLGPQHVVIKASQLKSGGMDAWFSSGEQHTWQVAPIDTPHTHGSGCVFSAALTANLALGCGVRDAIEYAREYVRAAIQTAPRLGKGRGPVNLFSSVRG